MGTLVARRGLGPRISGLLKAGARTVELRARRLHDYLYFIWPGMRMLDIFAIVCRHIDQVLKLWHERITAFLCKPALELVVAGNEADLAVIVVVTGYARGFHRPSYSLLVRRLIRQFWVGLAKRDDALRGAVVAHA